MAVSLLVIGTLSAPALADHPLAPDLVTLPLTESDLSLDQTGKGNRSILRMNNEVGNQGDGPVEVRASGSSENCDGDGNPDNDRIASQRIYRDMNSTDAYERGGDTDWNQSEIGCLQYHPKHSHWHFLEFSKYSLLSEATGLPTKSTKVGFCLGDSANPFPEIGPDSSFYRFSFCGTGDATPDFMGISVGWSDIYGFDTKGQRINVTGLEQGRYCLRSTADPVNLLEEQDEANNSTELRIKLNLEKGRIQGLGGSCVLG